MAEPFCETEPESATEKAFVRTVKEADAGALREFLDENTELRGAKLDTPWFDFDAPAVVWVASQLDRDKIRTLLDYGADINAGSEWAAGSYSALQHCLDGATPAKLEFAKFLIDWGAEIDLHSAAGLDRLDLVREIIDGDPERVHERGPDGARPLHLAASVEMADLLLDAGADPSARCVDHNSTAGMWLLKSYPEVSSRIAGRGGPVDIFMAAALGDAARVDECLAADASAISARIGVGEWTEHTGGGDKYIWVLGSHKSPHRIACDFGHDDLHRHRVEKSPSELKLIAACECGDRGTAERIVSEQPDAVQNLPLEYRRALADAAWAGDVECVRLMLDLGFDPHVVGDHDSAPIDRASFHGFREIVELLLEKDPNPPLKRQNEFGGMPLGTCLWGQIHGWAEDTDYPGTVRALLNAGSTYHPDWLPYPDKEIDAILREFPEAVFDLELDGSGDSEA